MEDQTTKRFLELARTIDIRPHRAAIRIKTVSDDEFVATYGTELLALVEVTIPLTMSKELDARLSH